MRTVPLWVGKTDDAPIPPRVRLRVWERCGGRCALTGRKIMPGEAWELDHRVALINGGAHAEENLQVVLVGPHKLKTREDVALKAKVARIRAKHVGAWPKSKRRLQSRGFENTRNTRSLVRSGRPS